MARQSESPGIAINNKLVSIYKKVQFNKPNIFI
jgi:hypothetical protein